MGNNNQSSNIFSNNQANQNQGTITFISRRKYLQQQSKSRQQYVQ